jgi:hypothetical protein
MLGFELVGSELERRFEDDRGQHNWRFCTTGEIDGNLILIGRNSLKSPDSEK